MIVDMSNDKLIFKGQALFKSLNHSSKSFEATCQLSKDFVRKLVSVQGDIVQNTVCFKPMDFLKQFDFVYAWFEIITNSENYRNIENLHDIPRLVAFIFNDLDVETQWTIFEKIMVRFLGPKWKNNYGDLGAEFVELSKCTQNIKGAE